MQSKLFNGSLNRLLFLSHYSALREIDASERSNHALGFVLIKDEGHFCQKEKSFIILRLCWEDKYPDILMFQVRQDSVQQKLNIHFFKCLDM